VNLFIQGMRRSGTTILYDALREDPGLRCFYEPLREQDETPGGGSGARDEDAFAETRALREAFRDERYPGIAIDEFNWGGPRDPALELESELPAHCREWLASLLELGDSVAIKETRLAHKAAELAGLDSDAAFVHMVRDPRAVASSIVLGRGRRQLERLRDADGFFSDRKPRKLWSSRGISEALPATAAMDDPTNVERVLMVWGDNFEAARAGGTEHFGERYLLLRNEDLRSDPARTLGRLYSLLGREGPGEVVEWAAAHVRAPENPFAAGDPRWFEAIERTGVAAATAAAGYSVDPAATLER
jgi:Sulfotransferase family